MYGDYAWLNLLLYKLTAQYVCIYKLVKYQQDKKYFLLINFCLESLIVCS